MASRNVRVPPVLYSSTPFANRLFAKSTKPSFSLTLSNARRIGIMSVTEQGPYRELSGDKVTIDWFDQWLSGNEHRGRISVNSQGVQHDFSKSPPKPFSLDKLSVGCAITPQRIACRFRPSRKTNPQIFQFEAVQVADDDQRTLNELDF